MKQSILFTILFSVFLMASGQGREVDLEAVIYSPNPGYTYYSPSADTVKYFLVNHGPDTIYQWDFQYTYILIGTSILDPWVARRFPYPMLPGDTLRQSYAMDMNFSITNDSIPLCVHAKTVPERGGDFLREEEGHGHYSNNEHCITVHHVSRTPSIERNDPQENQMKVYPNPSRGVFTVGSNLKRGQVELIDLYGRVCWRGPLTTDVTIRWAIQGTYFVRLFDEQGQVISVKKLVIL